MNDIINLCDDLFNSIIENLTIKQLVFLSKTSTFFQEKIISNFDEYVYFISSNNRCINALSNENTLYYFYVRGKSYCRNDTPDVFFCLRDEEYVLYRSEIKLNCYGPGMIIATINRNLSYTLYEFCQEVDGNEEYTPDYYGWDENDFGKLILRNATRYNHIKDIMLTYMGEDYGEGNSEIWNNICLVNRT